MTRKRLHKKLKSKNIMEIYFMEVHNDGTFFQLSHPDGGKA